MYVMHMGISFEVLVAFRRWPSLAETGKCLILLLNALLYLMEFNPNGLYSPAMGTLELYMVI
jgi:hypothetical protein